MESKTTLRDVFARRLEHLGGPVSTEEILALHDAIVGDAEMPAEEHERLLSRVTADPVAARRLRELLRFPEVEVADEDADPALGDRRWQALRARLGDELPPARLRVADSRRWLPLAASFMLGAGLILLAGQLGIGPGDEAPSSAIRANPQVVQFSLIDGPDRTLRVETLRTESESLNLTILPPTPIAAGAGPFRLAVHDRVTAEELFVNDRLMADRGGVLRLDVPRETWHSGTFELRLTRDGVAIATYTLELEILP